MYIKGTSENRSFLFKVVCLTELIPKFMQEKTTKIILCCSCSLHQLMIIEMDFPSIHVNHVRAKRYTATYSCNKVIMLLPKPAGPNGKTEYCSLVVSG